MTLEELRKLDHDVYVHFRDEICRVVVAGGDRYLLTNNCNYHGSSPSKMYGYRYSWWLCSKYTFDSRRIHRCLKLAKRRPL